MHARPFPRPAAELLVDTATASSRRDGWGRHAGAMLSAMLLAGMILSWQAGGRGEAFDITAAAADSSHEALEPRAVSLPSALVSSETGGDEVADDDLAPPPTFGRTTSETSEPPEPTEPAAGEEEAPDAPTPAEIETLAATPELTAALTEAIASSEVAERVGVAVVAADGTVAFDHRADRPRMPASAAKLITAALVVDTLGVDHRLTTEVIADGEVDDGLLDGDLVLVGAGDPALAHPEFERILARWPRTRLEDLADEIAGSLGRITGDVVGDAHAWAHEPRASGWPQQYLDRGYARHTSALTVNAGTEIVERDDATLAIPVTDPAREAAAELHNLLTDRDVTIDGEPRHRDGPVAGSPVASVEGEPLDVVMAEMMRGSDNVLADGLWRAAGATDRAGSWSSSERRARDLLRRAGADTAGLALADGSGLSRDSRVSPVQLATLDAAMARGEHAEAWRELMGAAGNARHLQRRLAGSDAHGTVRAKTGTLRDVRSLAGHVAGQEGRWHVAVIGDGLSGEQPWQVRDLIDELVELLARHARGCGLASCSPG